jgi:hypothetical protein
VFSSFKRDSDYFGSDMQQSMLELRVQEIDGLLKKLEAAGVRIDPKARSRTTAASRGCTIGGE